MIQFSISMSLVLLVLWSHSDTVQVCATPNLERSPFLQVCVPNSALLRMTPCLDRGSGVEGHQLLVGEQPFG